MAISRDVYPYVKFKYIFQFLTPSLPIKSATFIGLRWRIRGVLFSLWTSNVKGREFSKSKNLRNFDLLGAWRSGVWKVAIFTAKVSSLRECTSFEPFCVKIGCGVWPPEVSRKKGQKVTRGSHTNDTAQPVIKILPHLAAKFENMHYGLWKLRRAITRVLLKIRARCLH